MIFLLLPTARKLIIFQGFLHLSLPDPGLMMRSSLISAVEPGMDHQLFKDTGSRTALIGFTLLLRYLQDPVYRSPEPIYESYRDFAYPFPDLCVIYMKSDKNTS
jgi:hypothetical protein